MSQRRRPTWPVQRHYPRIARINELLREVLADEIELAAATDSRLELMTVTAVSCEPDLRHAKVFLASLPEPALTALGKVRPRLQRAVAHQVKLKRTPQLSFEADPAIAEGAKVEEILRAIHAEDAARAGVGGAPTPGGEVAKASGTKTARVAGIKNTAGEVQGTDAAKLKPPV